MAKKTEQSQSHTNLTKAKSNAADEFYTQYEVIEAEVQHYLEYDENVFRGKTILLPCDDPSWSNFTQYFLLNFDEFGLKRLICTSYNKNGKGKVADITDSKTAIQWNNLNGDGDFKSEEVTNFRDRSDFIITNPPFSLFRDFIDWIFEAEKKFLIIGNLNAITYKNVFPLIQDNKVWLGPSISSGDREFRVPSHYPLNAAGVRIDDQGNKFIKVKGVRWFTNIEHGKRHTFLPLMTTKDNLKYSNHSEIKGKSSYDAYSNYPAIEIPYTDAIPSDHKGDMGVPISFLDKYCPEQFEIIRFRKGLDGKDLNIDGVCPYFRIIIRKK